MWQKSWYLLNLGNRFMEVHILFFVVLYKFEISHNTFLKKHLKAFYCPETLLKGLYEQVGEKHHLVIFQK